MAGGDAFDFAMEDFLSNLASVKGPLDKISSRKAGVGSLPRQHFLYFLPLPQGQGSFLPIFFFFFFLVVIGKLSKLLLVFKKESYLGPL
jgi:hypothetical protein